MKSFSNINSRLKRSQTVNSKDSRIKGDEQLPEYKPNNPDLNRTVEITIKIIKTGKVFYLYQNNQLISQFADELKIKKENFFAYKQLPSMKSLKKIRFEPPLFGVTTLGSSHGFDAHNSTSGFILWVNKRGIMIDPPPYSSQALRLQGIPPLLIEKVFTIFWINKRRYNSNF